MCAQRRVFAFRMKKAWILSHPLSAQRRLIRPESSLGAHSFCWFCHEAAQISTKVAGPRIEPATFECLLVGAPDRSRELFPEPRPVLGNVDLHGDGW